MDCREDTIPRVGPTFEGNLSTGENSQIATDSTRVKSVVEVNSQEPVSLTNVNVTVSSSASLGASQTVADLIRQFNQSSIYSCDH